MLSSSRNVPNISARDIPWTQEISSCLLYWLRTRHLILSVLCEFNCPLPGWVSVLDGHLCGLYVNIYLCYDACMIPCVCNFDILYIVICRHITTACLYIRIYICIYTIKLYTLEFVYCMWVQVCHIGRQRWRTCWPGIFELPFLCTCGYLSSPASANAAEILDADQFACRRVHGSTWKGQVLW